MILNILTAYNEIKFMPLKKKWCDMNGLDLYVIDNYSNDGTWEWLQENNVMSHRIDTKGAFDLSMLQGEMTRTIHKIRPLWVIYNGADTFPVTRGKLCDDIMDVKKQGFNQIAIKWINICNTGEEFNGDYINTYFYFQSIKNTVMISEYHNRLKISADVIQIRKPRIKIIEGFNINYGNAKPAIERNETYARRKLAWDRGMIKAWGIHYKPGSDRNWLWKKSELSDIRTTTLMWAIEKLKKL